MIISFREKLLLKQAENYTKGPWNSSDRSNIEPKSGEKEKNDTKEETLQIIFNIPLDEERNISDEESPFINWESRNSMSGRFEKTKKDERC